MKRKTKIIVSVAAALVVLVALVVFFSMNGAPNFLSISGANTLSLTQATLQSSNPQLNGQAWMLTFATGGLGQSYYGSFSPSTVDAATTDSSKTTKTFSIEVDSADNECVYPIQSTGTVLVPIYDLNYKEWSCVLTPSESDAKSKTGFSGIKYYGRSGFVCYAVGYNTVNNVGSFGSPDVGAEYTITINTPDTSVSKTIKTLSSSTSGSIGDIAYASWIGNFQTGKACPSTSDVRPANVNGQWKIINKQSYDSYVSLYNQALSSGSSKADVQNWYSKVKAQADQAKISRSLAVTEGTITLDSAVMTYTSPKPLAFPLTTLYIKASAIGVYTPAPNIEINSASSSCFQTGLQGAITVSLTNTGEKGNVNVYATCNSPFQATRNTQISLDKGQTKTVTLELSANAAQETTGSCTVYAESTGGTKSKTLNTCVKPQVSCLTPYPQKFCGVSNGKQAVMQCSQNGAVSQTLQVCDTGTTCNAESGSCVAEVSSEEAGDSVIGGLLANIKHAVLGIFSGTLTFLTYLKYAFIVIISLLGWFAIDSNLMKLNALRRNATTRRIVTSIITVLIAIALIMFIGSFWFWVGVIGIAVYFIVTKLVLHL